jgi:hypothetical protein
MTIQLHVSAIGFGHHHVVYEKLIDRLYTRVGKDGSRGGENEISCLTKECMNRVSCCWQQTRAEDRHAK